MTSGAVTFDFHNTLASCDAWFHLEVRTLVSAFLRWHAESSGTVYSNETLLAADHAYRRLREEIHVHGHELPAERCVATILDDIGLQATALQIERGVRELMDTVHADVSPIAGAIETVRSLAGAGIRLGVVSSAVYHPFLERTLDRFGIRAAFQAVTSSASSGYYKSRPEIYWRTLDQLGASPENSVHVGDSLRFDVGGAKLAGMRAVLVSADQVSGEVDGHKPDLVIASLLNSAPAISSILDRFSDALGSTMPLATP